MYFSNHKIAEDILDTKLVVLKGKEIRHILFENEWYFSVVDIISILPDSEKPRNYWYRMKNWRWNPVILSCRQLNMESTDGKNYLTEFMNTESAFRIIQSIPSAKAEPFKRRLAKVG
jgi:DNA-damage-inducible protein D